MRSAIFDLPTTLSNFITKYYLFQSVRYNVVKPCNNGPAVHTNTAYRICCIMYMAYRDTV